jgi:parvulin-like peptidyl-prolyl isomerase
VFLAVLVGGCAQTRLPLAKVGPDGLPRASATTLEPLSQTINKGPEPSSGPASMTPKSAETTPRPTSVPAKPMEAPGAPPPPPPPQLQEVPSARPAEPAPLLEPGVPPYDPPPSTTKATTRAPVDDAIRRAASPTEDAPSQPAPADPEAKAEAEVQTRASMRSSVTPEIRLGTTLVSVGSEDISQQDLQLAFREWVEDHVPPDKRLAPADQTKILDGLLQELIDRAVIVQEAKRTILKSDKAQKGFEAMLEKEFHDHQLPALLRRYKVKTERELDEQLRAKGRTLNSIKEAHRLDALKSEFVRNKIGPRLHDIGKWDMERYYSEHIQDYLRPAQVTWREIAIKAEGLAERPEARRRLEAARERLQRGEDFATMARSISQGPTATKGGERITEPKASAVPAINEALEKLPIGQVSPVLEGPSGFYLVRVDARRPPGPASFVEVQGEVIKALREEILEREATIFIQKLRKRTVIVRHVASGTEPADSRVQRPTE